MKLDTTYESNLQEEANLHEEKNMRKDSNRNVYKSISLCVLTVQNALLILSMRYSRIQTGDMYITTTAVVLSETIKLIICAIVLCLIRRSEERESLGEFFAFLYKALVINWRDTLKLSIPAIVYMIQNNLQYVAVSNLDPAVFQVTYQLKILTTAIFSVLILKKVLSLTQWASLVTLFGGVVLVQLKASSGGEDSNNQIIGLLSVIISCLSSGFAGVYMEKMIKEAKVSLWLRNIQLSLFGAITAVLGMIMNEGDSVATLGFFYGYNYLVVFVIFQQALGGLIVSLVVKYADNILKGFSTSLSIIISCVASVFLFSYVITIQFVFGAALVIAAIYLYGKYPPKKGSIVTAQQSRKEEVLPSIVSTPSSAAMNTQLV